MSFLPTTPPPRPVATLPDPNVGIRTGNPGGVKPIAWPRLRLKWPRINLPKVLDADDGRMLGRLAVYTLLLTWAVVMIALALGFAVRLFLLAKGG